MMEYEDEFIEETPYQPLKETVTYTGEGCNDTPDGISKYNDYETDNLVVPKGSEFSADIGTNVDNINPAHYTSMAISPHEYNKANNIPWNEAQVIKYVSRWKKKNGLEDLFKSLWYLSDLIKGEIDILSETEKERHYEKMQQMLSRKDS